MPYANTRDSSTSTMSSSRPSIYVAEIVPPAVSYDTEYATYPTPVSSSLPAASDSSAE